MSPNLTLGYMAEQINRGRLDGAAERAWLADEAAATYPRTTRPDQMRAMLGAALVRLGESIQGTTRPAGAPANPARPATLLAL